MKNNYILSSLFLVFGLFFSFNVQAQIVANLDQSSVIHSNNVQIAIQNVLGNDTLNNIPVTLSQVTLTQISSSANISLQPNGSVVLSAGASVGQYIIAYQICEIASPNNCDVTSAIINVTNAPIVVGIDNVTISTGLAPQIILENVLSNDTLGGIPISISNVTISQVSSTYFRLDPITGSISQVGSPPAGTYVLSYYYCERGTNNCVSTTATITVVNSLTTIITSSYQDFNGDGVTNVGDVINYTYSITNRASSSISNISITGTDVNINGGPPIPSLSPNASNNTTYTGVHPITQADINSGSVIVSIQTLGTLSGNPISITTTNTRNLNISNGIKLNAFLDYNSNGTQDAGEPSADYGSFQYELNNNGTIHNISASDGLFYLYETNPANSYDFGYTLNTQYTAQYAVTPPAYPNVTVPNGSGVVSYNFALRALNPSVDLGTYIYGLSMPRPGFTYISNVYLFNYGNQTIASGTVTFTGASNLTISSYPPGSTPTANGFTYNFTNLLPGENRTLSLQQLVPTIPTVSLGDWVTNSVSTTIPTNDVNAYNNSYTSTSIIVGSYDPNDKAESHGPQIQYSNFNSNDYLTYTIRFENTGTAEAINIKVTDLLDSKLNETSVKMIKASHPYVLDRVGRNLTWKFNGINLDPSIPNNPTVGHGYLIFQVKPKPGYVIGDVISNTANIYFDFNPAIVTNTWTSTFVPLLGVQNFAFENFNYHPNPVKNNLTLSSSSTIDTVEIISVLGQKVKLIQVNDLQTEIDLSDLTRGIYLVKATSNGQEKTVKIIKE